MDTLLKPLNIMIESSEILLSEADGLLNPFQERFISSILQVANEMQTLIVSLPDMMPEKVREMFSFEMRSNLASIIGYAEVLLDETDGELNDVQRQMVRLIRSNGSQLMKMAVHMMDVSG